jgi:hypothetical protein
VKQRLDALADALADASAPTSVHDPDDVRDVHIAD